MMIGQRPARGMDPFIPPQEPMFQMDVPPVATPIAAPMQADKPKINWLGVLADALAGAAGQPGQYAQSVREQRREQSAFERGEQQYQRRRMDDREDKIWERDNTPKSPYRWESNDGSLMEMVNGIVRKVYDDPTPKMIQVPGVDANGNPVMRLVPLPKAGVTPPTGPVGGWADEGGQTPPASGNFPSGSPLDPNLGRPPRPYYR